MRTIGILTCVLLLALGAPDIHAQTATHGTKSQPGSVGTWVQKNGKIVITLTLRSNHTWRMDVAGAGSARQFEPKFDTGKWTQTGGKIVLTAPGEGDEHPVPRVFTISNDHQKLLGVRGGAGGMDNPGDFVRAK